MTTYPCPVCRALADDVSGCPRCGRAPDPDAAEVIRLDAEIPVLALRAGEARRAWQAADAAVAQAWHRRTAAAARVTARLAAPAPSAPPAPAAPLSAAPVAVRPEASTRTVQNVLFLLGGLLLGTAAIVFTAVAWNTFGVGGRALLLAAFTAVALGVPLLALRRRLTATAETIAAVGLLLVLLDGYAAWYVNLFGVAAGSAPRYAAAVCGISAAVGAGYARLTGLTGPRFAALAVAQPVLPLAVAPLSPSGAVWAWTLTAVAALNLAVVLLAGPSLRRAAWTLGTAWLAAAGLTALLTSALASRPVTAVTAGAALLGVSVLALAGAVVSRRTPIVAAAAGLAVIAVGTAAARPLLLLDRPSMPAVIAAVAATVAAAVAGLDRFLPPAVRSGPRAGAYAVLGVPALGALAGTLAAVTATVDAARPAFAADWLARPGGRVDWSLTVAVALLLAGLLLLLPRAARRATALGGAVVLALGLTAGLHLPWWTASAFLVAVAAAALLTAARSATAAAATGRAALAIVGLLIAAAVGVGRPATLAAVFGAVLLTGLAGARLALPGPGRTTADVTAGVGLLLAPATVAAALAATAAPDRWVARAALLTLAALAVLRWLVPTGLRRPAHAAVLGAASTAPAWAAVSGDAPAIYAAVALLTLAVTHSAVTHSAVTHSAVTHSAVTHSAASHSAASHSVSAAAPAAVVPGLWLAAAVLPSLLDVLAAPYAQLGRVWEGPAAAGPAAAGAAWALGIVAVAVTVLNGRSRGALLSVVPPIVAAAALVGLAAAGVPWPVLPVLSLGAGLAGLLGAAVRRRVGADVTAGGFASAAFLGAGLAGALATRPTTLAAFGVTAAVGAACGAAGRTALARTAGWLGAVAAAVAFAVAAGPAAQLAPAGTAYGVLAVAALALAGGAALRGRRPGESAAVQAAAHMTAVLALLLCAGAGAARPAAAVCTLWGVALGLRALWPGEAAAPRRLVVVGAAGAELLGWWIVAASGGVTVVEAYTVPAAAVALLAGWLALRTRPELTSWLAWSPALAAALLPSLAAVLVVPGEPLRRLLLGVGALGVVLAGAWTRRQAPVVIGGGVLLLVALHELLLVWDLMPRWIPLAAGGLLLVGLAMTLERRRRDLHRVRAAVARMT